MPFRSSRLVEVTREGIADKGKKRSSLKLSFLAEGWKIRRNQQKRLRRSSWGGRGGVGQCRVLELGGDRWIWQGGALSLLGRDKGGATTQDDLLGKEMYLLPAAAVIATN